MGRLDRISNIFFNTSVHEGTKCTSYELVFGKLAELSSSIPPPEHEKLETSDIYMRK